MRKTAFVLGILIQSASAAHAAVGAPATAPAPKIPVLFALGQTYFADGDRITITGIVGDRDRFEIGGTYRVWGTYSLVSQPSATLMLLSTNGEIVKGPANRKKIRKGSGEFDVTAKIVKDGRTHVSFYSPNGGESFGGVYFGPAGAAP